MRWSNAGNNAQQQQLLFLQLKYTQQMNYRNSMLNNASATTGHGNTGGNNNRHHINSGNKNVAAGVANTYVENSPAASFRPLKDPQAEKLLIAREAREELDLYKSFELDEDREFYPHQQHISNIYTFDNNSHVSTADLYLVRQQQQVQQQQYLLEQQNFRSPLSTPDRSNYQTNLSLNRVYSTSGFNANTATASPQRANGFTYTNNSNNVASTVLANRSLGARPLSGQVFYSQYNNGNRSRV